MDCHRDWTLELLRSQLSVRKAKEASQLLFSGSSRLSALMRPAVGRGPGAGTGAPEVTVCLAPSSISRAQRAWLKASSCVGVTHLDDLWHS